MIYHSVFFRLKHVTGSQQEYDFMEAAKALASISGVVNFQVLRQTSVKNNFDYGLLMEFSDQQKYDFYSNCEEHVQFVEKFWLPNVEDFMEIDYEQLAVI